MKRIIKNFKVLFIFFGIIIFYETLALADDCNMGRTPEGVYPMNNGDVTMISEEVFIKLEEGKAKCNFEFKNIGKAKDVLMGFPAQQKISDEFDDEYHRKRASITNFKTIVDEQEIPVKLEIGINPSKTKAEKSTKYTAWYTFNVHFNENETKIINNSYEFKNTVVSTGRNYGGYIIDTGSYWRGNIGYAKVYFDMGSIKPYMIRNIAPIKYFKFQGDNLIFECRDFEPDFNLSVDYNTIQYGDEYIQKAGTQYRDCIKKCVKRFGRIQKIINEGEEEKLIKLYNDAVENEDAVEAKYILSALLEGAVKNTPPKIEYLAVEEYSGPSHSIEMKVKDGFGDIAFINIEISHVENCRKIIDKQERWDYRNECGTYKIETGLPYEFKRDKTYRIKVSVIDMDNQMSEKEIDFIY